MSIDYKAEVLKVFPDAQCVLFENSALKWHIRQYRDEAGYPRSIGKANTENEAWAYAYFRILNNTTNDKK